jgi:LysM repeat protein
MLQRVGSGVIVVLSALAIPSSATAYRYLHRVVPGETLRSIARQYRTSPIRIRRVNRLKSNRIRPGQQLEVVTRYRLRGATSRTAARDGQLKGRARLHRTAYRVRRGDSLSEIAERHRMKLATLIALNRRASRGKLRVGQRLWVLKRARQAHRRRRLDLLQLTSGPGYMVRNPDRAWGTFLTVTRLMDLMEDYHQAYPKDPRVRIHDISRRRGGYLFPHRSHRLGRDVDIVYPVRARFRGVKYSKIKVHMVDLGRTWFMIKRLLQTKDVTFIFVDRRLQRRLFRHARRQGEDPRWLRQVFQHPPPASRRAIIRHEPGHDDHLHVRFRPADKVPPVA